MRDGDAEWPDAPVAGWLNTCETIQLWTQVVGKIRLALAPEENHWWHVPLYLTADGLTTSVMPHAGRFLQIDFDFLAHRLIVKTSTGATASMALYGRPLRDFYSELLEKLTALGFPVRIWPVPVEMNEAVPFDQDDGHSEYDPVIAERIWRILLRADQSLKEFRGGFLGKASPVHFFWGSFDLAATRFSGRRAPRHPGGVPNLADWVARDGYSHELSSCGFWPGTAGRFERPAFYAYAYPEPEGLGQARIRPDAGFYHPGLREFLLPYDDLPKSAAPAETVRDFLQSTYEAIADLGRWNRGELER